jgi:UDP-N-acetylglucosamine 4,6-dehydratase
MLDGKSILVTGGTGSFGKAFIARVLKEYPSVKKIIVYSRDELKQFDMSNMEPFKSNAGKLRFFIGNVRDGNRLKRACEGVDIIIHAAALKQVPAAEYNPMEFINTNIIGAENVVNAAFDCGVSKVVALSTDKAAAPINLYGATKLCSDKLITAANNIKGSRELSFSVVRYGNVMGSRGSVIPFFIKKANEGVLPITHEEMTRFNISLDEGVDMVLYAIENAWGGEIFVPKIPSYKVTEVAKAIGPNCDYPVVGIRPGEKIHEEMITETDSMNTLDCGKYYVILPSMSSWNVDEFINHFKAKKVPFGFKYNSGENTEWVNVEQIRDLLKKHVDPDFSPVE